MPINVMLVDDEMIVRIGMKSVIDWEGNGFRYAGEASDGAEALELLDEVNPDIVLTDIKMPNVNGIQLIEAVKKRKPDVRILVLSSHDEFDYVRSAMKLGADDYVLKASVDPDKLIRLLKETAGKLPPNRKDDAEESAVASGGAGRTEGDPLRKSALEGALHRALESRLRQDERELPELREAFAGGTAYVAVARRTKGGAGDNRAKGAHSVEPTGAVGQAGGATAGFSVDTLVHVLELNARKWARATVAKATQEEVVLVLGFRERAERGRFAEIGADLVSAAERYAGTELELGFGGACSEPGELATGYAQAGKALERGFYGGGERTFVHGAAESPGPATVVPSLSQEKEKALGLAIERLDEKEIARVLGGWFSALRASRPPVAQAIRICLDLYYALQSGFRKFGYIEDETRTEDDKPAYSEIVGFSKLRQAELWFERYVAGSLLAIRSAPRERGREEILELVAHMRERFDESLTLKQAADIARMSESYLSYLFKKETGKGFVEFLNELRIERAAGLLRDTHLPSYAIAEKVGYENINYFGRIFKKVKGMSPKRYRANYTIGSTTSIPTE